VLEVGAMEDFLGSEAFSNLIAKFSPGSVGVAQARELALPEVVAQPVTLLKAYQRCTS
jgi:hypothetical protein